MGDRTEWRKMENGSGGANEIYSAQLAFLKQRTSLVIQLVKTLHFHSGGTGAIPDRGSFTGLAVWPKRKEKKKNSTHRKDKIVVKNSNFGVRQTWAWITDLPFSSCVTSA